MGWLYAKGWGGNNVGRILDNGKAVIYLYSTSANLITLSDGATVVFSAASSISLNTKIFFAVSRAADGTVNFYIGSPTVRPALSGTANQASGTPAAGTTNLCAGNRIAADRAYNGHFELNVKPLATNYLPDIYEYWEMTKDTALQGVS